MTMKRNSLLDTIPPKYDTLDIDKKILLRQREANREIGDSFFKLKSFAAVKRINEIYDNSSKMSSFKTLPTSPQKRLPLPLQRRQDVKI